METNYSPPVSKEEKKPMSISPETIALLSEYGAIKKQLSEVAEIYADIIDQYNALCPEEPVYTETSIDFLNNLLDNKIANIIYKCKLGSVNEK